MVLGFPGPPALNRSSPEFSRRALKGMGLWASSEHWNRSGTKGHGDVTVAHVSMAPSANAKDVTSVAWRFGSSLAHWASRSAIDRDAREILENARQCEWMPSVVASDHDIGVTVQRAESVRGRRSLR